MSAPPVSDQGAPTSAAVTPEEWSRRLRLLLQEEEEAARAVAEWAVSNDDMGLTSTPGSYRALKRFRNARSCRLTFLRLIQFP